MSDNEINAVGMGFVHSKMASVNNETIIILIIIIIIIIIIITLVDLIS